MMPDDVLSTTPVEGAYLAPKNTPWQALVDYDQGPIDIVDTSRGLQVRQWRMRYEDGNVLYDAPGVADRVVLAVAPIQELSATFDQNGHPCVAYVLKSDLTAHMYWYDPAASGYVTFHLPTDATCPRVVLDDKRAKHLSTSDIIMAYVRGTSLYTRKQRERFLTERLMTAAFGKTLKRVGMTNKLRLQFEAD